MKIRDAKEGKINSCQICGASKLVKVISLGSSGLCDSLIAEKNLNKFEKTFPLNLFRCQDCQLLQLDYIVNNKEVFHLNYPYKSGITPPLRKYLHNTSYYAKKNFNFSKN